MVVSFFESWCGTCQAEQPELTTLANDPSGRTWARWRVPYQPVVVVVDTHGRVAERFEGGTTGGTLAAALGSLLGE